MCYCLPDHYDTLTEAIVVIVFCAWIVVILIRECFKGD